MWNIVDWVGVTIITHVPALRIYKYAFFAVGSISWVGSVAANTVLVLVLVVFKYSISVLVLGIRNTYF